MRSIGIDIGKTNIKWVTLDPSGAAIAREEIPTPKDVHIIDVVRSIVQEDVDTSGGEATCLGLASPGLASKDSRMIACLPGGQPAIEGIDWTELLAWPMTVPILNDANAALFAEAKSGAAAGYQHVFMLTLGTGIGGAMMIEGRLVHGRTGKAGHLGHISIHPDWPKSLLGMPGSLEYAFGDRSVAERSGGRFHSNKDLATALSSDDILATKLWHDGIRHLARGIVSLTNVLDPDIVVIGGGVTEAGEMLFKPLRDAVAELEWCPTGEPVPIVPAKLGPHAGAIGAALYAKQICETMAGE